MRGLPTSSVVVSIVVAALVLTGTAAGAEAQVSVRDPELQLDAPERDPSGGDSQRTASYVLFTVSGLLGFASVPLTLVGAINSPNRSECYAGYRDCTEGDIMVVTGAVVGAVALVGAGVGFALSLGARNDDRRLSLRITPAGAGGTVSLTGWF